MNRPVVAIDLDGVLASWDHGTFDVIGPPIRGAVDFTRRIAEYADIVIHTCRCTESLYSPSKAHVLSADIRDWLDKHGFSYHRIWIGQGKPIADAYVDDRAIRCDPERDELAFGRTECELSALLHDDKFITRQSFNNQ
jgi:hypothetical protein